MKQHTDWLISTIQTIPALAAKTFNTIVPHDTVAPYVVVYPSDGVNEQDRFTGPMNTVHPRFTVQSVGITAEQAAAAAALVRAKLIVTGLGVIPTIAGENTRRVWYSVPQAIQADRDVEPPLIYHTAECGFASDLT